VCTGNFAIYHRYQPHTFVCRNRNRTCIRIYKSD